MRGRGAPRHLGGSSLGVTGLLLPAPSGTQPPPLSVLQEDPEPPHPTLAPESTGLAHPTKGPHLGAAPQPPRGPRRLSLRSRRSPSSQDPAALVAPGPPLGLKEVPAHEPSQHARVLSHGCTCVVTRPPRQPAAGGWEGLGRECHATTLCLPSPASDLPAHPPPQVLSHRGSPSGCGGVGTEGESQAAGRGASPRCTGPRAHTAALLGHNACTQQPDTLRPQRMHTSSQTHSGHTDPHTLTPPGTHSLLYPGASPGSFLEGKRGAAGRLAQGPHSSPFPAPGQPGVRGASSGPWRRGGLLGRVLGRPRRGVSAANTPDLSAGRAEAGGALGGRPTTPPPLSAPP